MEKRKLTICFFAEADDLEIHSLKWIRYFVDKDYNIHLFSYSSRGKKQRESIKVHIIEKKFPKIKAWPWNTLINFPFTLFKIRKLVKEINPDIIHGHCVTSYGTLATIMTILTKRSCPLVVTAFGSDILLTPQKNIITKMITKYVLKRADLLTCDAEHMLRAMVDLGADERKIRIINFGIDVKKFSPGPRDERIKKKLQLTDYKTVISLKWLDPLSDIQTLLEAASLVVKKNPDVKFILVGPGSIEKELKSLSSNLGIDKSVIFLGFVPNEEIPNYIRSSDVLVSTSLSDGGIAASTAEAMASGLPVIVTDFGDNKKWIKNGEGGFVIPPSKPEILAEKLFYLIENPDIGKRFGGVNRKIIEENNNYYREMEKVENIYKELAKIN